MALANVNGVSLYYEVEGEGECVVLTHGSWTDATSWEPVVARLAQRYRVVTWDRRGHSRSQGGDGAGCRAEDTNDLAGMIEHVSDGPVHVVGNSYGGNITLTLMTERPDLVISAAVHEPPLFGLLEGTPDPAVAAALKAAETELAVVRDHIVSGNDGAAARHFIEHLALGPGAWDLLPEAFRKVLEFNAPTYLDELDDDTALAIDAAALAATTTPLLLSRGTESPPLFPAVVGELVALMPATRVEVIVGAGHVPHSTHTEEWVARLAAFHEAVTHQGV
jgi:pimeloyl-ACP methyl ester carboxylesterase